MEDVASSKIKILELKGKPAQSLRVGVVLETKTLQHLKDTYRTLVATAE